MMMRVSVCRDLRPEGVCDKVLKDDACLLTNRRVRVQNGTTDIAVRPHVSKEYLKY